MGVTAVLIAHHKSLALNAVAVNPGWLPGISAGSAETPEFRSSLLDENGRHYLGTKAGLFVLANGKLNPVPALAGIEIRSLSSVNGAVLAAGNRGVWLLADGDWHAVYRQAAHSAQFAANGDIRIATPNDGLLLSRDGGQHWAADSKTMDAFRQLPKGSIQEDYSLGKLVLDIHTGKAFLGKRWEWIWIDLLGGLIAFLCLTGVYLWWRGQKRQATLMR